MSSKYTISTEAQVLLKLLRLALGTEPLKADGSPVEPFPPSIDWSEVIRLSYEQKVSALAADGLKGSGYDPREGKSGREFEKIDAALKSWFDDVRNTEASYTYYLEVLSILCQIFAANGLKPVILKGYGLSLDYPIPIHRGAGDIDIYLIDKDGKPAAECGDELMQKLFGISREQDKIDLHSQFIFKGISIENHYALVGRTWSYSNRNNLASFFERTIIKDIIEKDGFYLPSALFNATFLLKHMFVHLSDNRMSLRQLCDYGLFIKNHHKEIDWNQVQIFCKEHNLTDFAAGIHTMLGKEFCCDNCSFGWQDNPEWAEHILFDTFYFQKMRRTSFGKLVMYLRNPWHCKKIRKKNWLYLTLRNGIGHLRNLSTHEACSCKSE